VTRKSKMKGEGPALVINSEVLRRIRQHARSQSKSEVCGVLIGREHEGKLKVEASIPGVNAAQGGTHVTFTQDTWEHIYNVKDKEYPDERILGWYHSHPGFGVFLSDHDTFIHKNFFSSPQQVAWVYDPQSDEEGCFGWVSGSLERLSQLAVADSKGGECAGETGKPEPMGFDLGDDHVVGRDDSPRPESNPEPAWLRWITAILWYLVIFACGLVVAWVVFPRVVVMPVPVDPQTGRIIQAIPEGQEKTSDQNGQNLTHDTAQPAGKTSTDSAGKEKKEKDGQQRQ